MRKLRYDDQIWNRVGVHNPRCMVAMLCRPPADTSVEPFARIVENWSDRFHLPPDLRSQLTSADDDQFWSGFYHLATARLLLEIGFAVDLRAIIDGKTPDILISNEKFSAMVEVFALMPSAVDRQEAAILTEIRDHLSSTLALPPGNLSLSLTRPLQITPDKKILDALTREIDGQLAAGASREDGIGLQPFRAGVAMHGFFIRNEKISPPAIFLTPPGGAIGESQRLAERLGVKLKRYAPSVNGDRGLIIAVGSATWKATRHGLAAALYGPEQVAFNVTTGVTQPPAHSGQGVAVPGSIAGYVESPKLWGTLFVERQRIDETAPAMCVQGTFLYNPYAENPLPSDSFAPLAEQQVTGQTLTLVREDAATLHLP